eukprot:TRINITY_DN9708_c0_g1_i1.p1 TRINITY_DN9708_c0_g1~~TRINITY_DN9708_c0_g1_i1.p1  ORF type:complete len:787 (+),score=187.98 TRINITY_DN9708_c0_g1_i1:260-2362(+)
MAPLADSVAATSTASVGNASPEVAPSAVSAAGPPASALTDQVQAAVDVERRTMGLRTILLSLQACDRVTRGSVTGPFQVSSTDEDVPVVCFQFHMSHFTCKAYLAHGSRDEGSQHLKLQTVFEDNRRTMGEEQRYFVANEWNSTKRYTRLKCGSGGGAARSSDVFTLEYDVLVPMDTPHAYGLTLVSQTLRMWYTSMVACVMHIVEPRELPFATHDMIMSNTLAVAVREEDEGLLRETCPICFEAFRVGDTVRRLPCLHTFHVAGADVDNEDAQNHHCNIDRHLVCDKQCPVCKTPIDIMERLPAANGGKAACSAGACTAGDAAVSSSAGAEGATAADAEASASGTGAGGGSGREAAAAVVARDGATEALTDAARLPAATATGAPNVSDALNITRLPLDPTTEVAQAAAAGAAAAGVATAAAAALIAAQQGENAGGNGAGPPNAALLPAQAAELERAVRSLQSRWLQIQDVVAGMQQMLQYIEESQPMVAAQAANAEGTAAGGAAAAGGGSAAVDDSAPVGGPASGGGAAADRAHDGAPAPGAGSTSTAVAAAGEEATPEAAADGSEVAAVPAPAARPRENVGSSTALPVQTAAAAGVEGSEPAPLTAVATATSADPPRPSTVSRADEVEATAAAAGVPPQGWRSFTEAEKVCMAFVWRQRRAAALTAALASSGEVEPASAGVPAPQEQPRPRDNASSHT